MGGNDSTSSLRVRGTFIDVEECREAVLLATAAAALVVGRWHRRAAAAIDVHCSENEAIRVSEESGRESVKGFAA